jgi:hypothetical protein
MGKDFTIFATAFGRIRFDKDGRRINVDPDPEVKKAYLFLSGQEDPVEAATS